MNEIMVVREPGGGTYNVGASVVIPAPIRPPTFIDSLRDAVVKTPAINFSPRELGAYMPRKKKTVRKKVPRRTPARVNEELEPAVLELGQSISVATDEAAHDKFLAVGAEMCRKLREAFEMVLGNQLDEFTAKELRQQIAARVYQVEDLEEVWQNSPELRKAYRDVIVRKLLQSIGTS